MARRGFVLALGLGLIGVMPGCGLEPGAVPTPFGETAEVRTGLRGVVVDGLGIPVEGARVRTIHLESVEVSGGIEYAGPMPGSSEWVEKADAVTGEWVKTDSLGEFELAGLALGWYAVEVEAAGRVRFFLPGGDTALVDADLFELVNPGDWIDVGTVSITVGAEWPTTSDHTGTWYDVVPGFRYQYEATPEDDPELWESFMSFDEMNAVSQINPAILPTLSTPELLEAVLSYTFFGNYFAYNTLQDGMDAVIEGFNGLQELLSRPDAGQVLLDFYSSVDVETVLNGGDPVGTIRFDFLEMILAQNQVLTNLGASGRAELMAAVTRQAGAKLALPEQPFGNQAATLLAARIIWLDCPNLLADVDDVEAYIRSGFPFMDPFSDGLEVAIAQCAALDGAGMG